MTDRPVGKERALYPDVLRGFAIFLMLCGHCLQMGSGAEFRTHTLYFSDRVYQFIYSFHMPLFMLLSGALFAFSLNRNERLTDHFFKRLRRLVLPVLLWTAVELTVEFLRSPGSFSVSASSFLAEDFPGVSGRAAIILYCLVRFLTSHWFLWAVFFSGILVILIRRFAGDSLAAHLAILIAAFFVPDGLNAMMYKFMHPFFLIGYYGVSRTLARDPSRSAEERLPLPEIYEKHRPAFLAAFAAAFLVLFSLYSKDTFIYLSGYKLIGKADLTRQLWTDLYRFLVGTAGCGTMLILWDVLLSRTGDTIRSFRVLAAAGRQSLGIYILSQYVITGLLVPAADHLFPEIPALPVRYAAALLEAAAVLTVCGVLSAVLGKNHFTGMFIGMQKDAAENADRSAGAH